MQVNGDGMTNGSLGNTGGEIPGVEIGAPSSSAWQDCTIVEQDEEMPGLKSLDDARRAGKGRQLLDIQVGVIDGAILHPACPRETSLLCRRVHLFVKMEVSCWRMGRSSDENGVHGID